MRKEEFKSGVEEKGDTRNRRKQVAEVEGGRAETAASKEVLFPVSGGVGCGYEVNVQH